MEEIKLSIFDHGLEPIARLRSLLDQLREQRIYVRLEVLPWRGGWSRMNRVALGRHGPDVSEIGSTWVGDFAKMDALSAFSHQEIQEIAKKEDFLAPSWESGIVSAGGINLFPSLRAIPWSGDTRVVFYRRDLLNQAGIDEESAFQDAEKFEHSLERLKDNGIQTPLVIPTKRSRSSVHIAASWVWGAGGDFVSKDGELILFNHPQAIEGLKRYFRLGRYIPEQAQKLDDDQSNDMFCRGDAAITISGHWLLQGNQLAPEVRANLGAALVPGVPFVGGLHLAIWKHRRRKEAAISLIKFLVSSQASLSLFPSFGLPARLDALDQPPFSDDPIYRVMSRALKTGRPFPGGRFWGLIETRLTDLFPLIWRETLTAPEPGLDKVLKAQMDSLARRVTDA